MENACLWLYPRVLVIGPGGIKGLKALGFLSPLEQDGMLNHIDTFCGVSVGAILSLLLVSGYDIREIVREASALNIFQQLDTLNITQMISNKGLISNEPVRRRLSELMLEKFGSIPSLHGLYMYTGRSLITVTLNATDEECVMMGPSTHPDISCVDAVMFSMNIPFVFYQLIYMGKTYVDGALCNPYPVDYFDDGRTKILGIYMKAKNTTQFTNDALTTVDYTNKIVHSLMDQMYIKSVERSSDNCRHICLDAVGTETIGLGMKMEDKARLLIEGYNEGKEFIRSIQERSALPPKQSIQKYVYPEYYMGPVV
jgi:predicted acylesterase/phospholipase RssA